MWTKMPEEQGLEDKAIKTEVQLHSVFGLTEVITTILLPELS